MGLEGQESAQLKASKQLLCRAHSLASPENSLPLAAVIRRRVVGDQHRQLAEAQQILRHPDSALRTLQR